MSIDITVVRDLATLRSLDAEWRALATTGPNALFRGPDWLLPWWNAYHGALAAELHVLVGRSTETEGEIAVGEIVCLAPLYRRTIKVAMLDTREIRMMGDAGPRPPSLDLLARPGWEDRAGAAFAKLLGETADTWDLVELEPLADPSRVRAHMVQRMAPAGYTIESSMSAGGANRIALGLASPDATDGGVIATHGEDLTVLRKGLSALRRLSRLEWGDRDEPSPLADPEATALLEELALHLGKQGLVRLARLDDAQGETCAAALIVDDGGRAVVLAMAVDPQAQRAAPRLLHSEALAARSRGCIALDVVNGAADYALPELPTSKQPALAVRIWGTSATASVGRTYAHVARRARRARETPSVAAAQARAAWTKIRSAATSLAHIERFCLYRGQLWTRGLEVPAGLELTNLTEPAFDKLDEAQRADLCEQLALDDATIRRQWRRGDQSVLAMFGPRPAGIAWAARGPVEAPELGRTLQLAKYDAYMHSVFVSTSARGRLVAPVMLEHLAKELRAGDAYRSWALIEAENHASLRAFQKSSFTPVCDVIHTKMAVIDRVVCRPPDPEAQELLGLD
ncbi:MAG: GNAT family N-acetyltransferase [Proteobacteria bacterium]|nr:GNAT family N-acetyltransferase [Pseudomonadota bacterium]